MAHHHHSGLAVARDRWQRPPKAPPQIRHEADRAELPWHHHAGANSTPASAHMPSAGILALISSRARSLPAWWIGRRSAGSVFRNRVHRRPARRRSCRSAGIAPLWTEKRAILLYVEAIKDARKFMSAARAAARIEAVVVVKSGAWRRARSGCDPPGALAGSDAVDDAAFRRAGILRVSDLRELFDCAETLGRANRPPGSGWRCRLTAVA